MKWLRRILLNAPITKGRVLRLTTYKGQVYDWNHTHRQKGRTSVSFGRKKYCNILIFVKNCWLVFRFFLEVSISPKTMSWLCIQVKDVGRKFKYICVLWTERTKRARVRSLYSLQRPLQFFCTLLCFSLLVRHYTQLIERKRWSGNYYQLLDFSYVSLNFTSLTPRVSCSLFMYYTIFYSVIQFSRMTFFKKVE